MSWSHDTPCNFLFVLYNNLDEGKSCQIHGSVVIFRVEPTGDISFLVTRTFKQII